jgi:hypothetical protein
MSKIQKAIYGSVALFRVYCPDCDCYSLILEGKTLCCSRSVVDSFTIEEKKRMGGVIWG